MSETELITRILSGEDHLFARIVHRYSGYVWALCSSYIRNPSDCEDVTQEVFVQCYRRLDTLRNAAAFGQWLSQLARRHCLMWLRTSARRERHLAEYEEGIEAVQGRTGEAAMENPARDEFHQGIWKAVDALPPDFREAMLLRFAEGYSTEEASSFLGITPAAMRKRIERAQNMLKSTLWDQVEPALAKRKHNQSLARGILACVALGKAPWLGVTGAVSAASAPAVSKLALIGGIAVMSKKMAIGLGAIALILALTFLVASRYGPRRAETRPKAPSRVQEMSQPAPVAVAANASATRIDQQEPSPAPAAPAAVESPDRAAKEMKPASVSGFVGDSAARPIAGADIHVEIGRDRYCNDVAKRYSAKTGADGRYEISGIDTFGWSYVFATAEGYVMQRSRVEIRSGTKANGINFTLGQAAFFVEGRVVTENRMPIAEASVDILYYGYDETGLAHTAATGQTTGSISGAKFLFAITDKKGFFRVAIPDEGLCDFRVVKEGYGPGFFPQIATGTRDALFVLRSGGAIAGKVSGVDGTPVPGATVRVTGGALPGGLAPSSVRIQTLSVAPVVTTTDSRGDYLAEGLGEDYVYTVSAPMPEPSMGQKGLAADKGRGVIAGMMREFEGDVFGTESFGAQKTGVRVKAGQTTRDVDLVLGSKTGATIRGTVTDRSSGKPVCPVVVTATSVDSGADAGGRRRMWFQASFGGTAVTNLDGSYALQIQNLTETRSFSIGHVFMTEGGSAWEQPDEEAAVVDLGPGNEREVNFSVDAPVTVPVRYLDVKGAPIEGIEAAMRRAGGGGACGGVLISDVEGRVTFHGIRPLVNLEAVAWQGAGLKTIGVSEPFMGEPGETVPEVTVVCGLSGGLGGVEGVLVYPDGRVVANTQVVCQGQRADDIGPPIEGPVITDPNGAVRVPEIVPEGVYSLRVSFIDGQSGQPYHATAENVEIVAGAITNVGTLVAEPEKDPIRMLQTADWGRQANEAIAGMYSKEWLDALPNPSLFLKTGFALYDMGRYQEALDVFARMSETTKNDGLDSAVSLIWQGHMLDLLGRRQEAVAAYSTAADMNVKGIMRHDQFGLAYSPSEYAQQRVNEPFARVENLSP